MNNFPPRRASHGNLVRTAFGSDGATPHNARKTHAAKKRALLKGGLYSLMRALITSIGRIRFLRPFIGRNTLTALHFSYIYIYIYKASIWKNSATSGKYRHIHACFHGLFRPFCQRKAIWGPLILISIFLSTL